MRNGRTAGVDGAQEHDGGLRRKDMGINQHGATSTGAAMLARLKRCSYLAWADGHHILTCYLHGFCTNGPEGIGFVLVDRADGGWSGQRMPSGAFILEMATSNDTN